MRSLRSIQKIGELFMVIEHDPMPPLREAMRQSIADYVVTPI